MKSISALPYKKLLVLLNLKMDWKALRKNNKWGVFQIIAWKIFSLQKFLTMKQFMY